MAKLVGNFNYLEGENSRDIEIENNRAGQKYNYKRSIHDREVYRF